MEVLAADDTGVGAWAVGFPWEVAKTCDLEEIIKNEYLNEIELRIENRIGVF